MLAAEDIFSPAVGRTMDRKNEADLGGVRRVRCTFGKTFQLFSKRKSVVTPGPWGTSTASLLSGQITHVFVVYHAKRVLPGRKSWRKKANGRPSLFFARRSVARDWLRVHAALSRGGHNRVLIVYRVNALCRKWSLRVGLKCVSVVVTCILAQVVEQTGQKWSPKLVLSDSLARDCSATDAMPRVVSWNQSNSKTFRII
jgi:hypothetical protein